MTDVPDPRFSRLARYAGFAATLPRWQAACCAVVGLGGLGGGLALQLARLGVARLVLIDRDIVSAENLGHQPLFYEDDAAQDLPKAIAAQRAVAQVNSAVAVTAHVASLTRHNIAELLAGAELLFDGLDNYYTRFLLNDYALSTSLPYFYAGVVRGELSAKAVIPGVTSCLRCVLDAPPSAGEIPTCASEGVFPPLLGVANALQLDTANRYLAGNFGAADDVLYSLNVADWELRKLKLGGPRAGCPACGQRRFEYLDGTLDALARQSCAAGEAELQLHHPLELAPLAARLAACGEFEIKTNSYCIAVEERAADGARYTIFPSGRVVLSGGATEKLESFVATYLGA